MENRKEKVEFKKKLDGTWEKELRQAFLCGYITGFEHSSKEGAILDPDFIDDNYEKFLKDFHGTS